MNGRNRKISLAALPASGMWALIVVSVLSLALSNGAGPMQAWAGGGHGEGKGHDASQGSGSGSGLGGSVGGALGGLGGALGGSGGALGSAGPGGGALGGAAGGALGGTAGNSTGASGGGQSGTGGGSESASANASASASASPGAYYVGAGAIACSIEPDSCMGEMGTGLRDSEPVAMISASGPTTSGLRVPGRRPGDGVPATETSGGGGVPSDILAVYSTAQLADLPPGALALDGNALKADYGWKSQVLTTITGPVALGGSVLADTASTSSDAAAQADQVLAGGYQIWMGNFVSEHDARQFWKKQVRRYPALLKKLKPTLRRVHPGTAVAASYRLLGGSLANRAAAEHVCGSILSRSPHNVCRVVLS